MERRKVEEVVDCNHDRLYGSLDEAIKYLQEVREKYPQAQLEEYWYGYEDMCLRFTYLRDETDKEFEQRKEMQRIYEENVKREKEREKLKKEKLKQIEALKKELARL